MASLPVFSALFTMTGPRQARREAGDAGVSSKMAPFDRVATEVPEALASPALSQSSALDNFQPALR